MSEAWREAISVWEDFRAEPEEYRELDRERVLVLTRNSGRGRGSGLELAQMLTRTANLFHVRSGLVIYFDRDRALATSALFRRPTVPLSALGTSGPG